MLFYGWRRFGVVTVGNGLSVATMFFHLFWIPLVPYRGLILLDKDRGIQSKLRLRSILIGYGRVWGPVLLVAGYLYAANSADGPRTLLIFVFGAAGVLLTMIGYVPAFATVDETDQAEIEQELREALNSRTGPVNP